MKYCQNSSSVQHNLNCMQVLHKNDVAHPPTTRNSTPDLFSFLTPIFCVNGQNHDFYLLINVAFSVTPHSQKILRQFNVLMEGIKATFNERLRNTNIMESRSRNRSALFLALCQGDSMRSGQYAPCQRRICRWHFSMFQLVRLVPLVSGGQYVVLFQSQSVLCI